MSRYLEELLDKKTLIESRLKEYARELLVIQSMIDKEKKGEEQRKIGKNSTNKLFYQQKIIDLLTGHPVGLKTKEIYHLLSVFVGDELNDSTCRSYLSRMKKKGIIYQDQKKNWHLKE